MLSLSSSSSSLSVSLSLSLSLSLTLTLTHTHTHTHTHDTHTNQKAMTNDQIREVEVILDGIVKANNAVFAREAPLPLAKEVQGLRACFDEVRSYVHHFAYCVLCFEYLG